MPNGIQTDRSHQAGLHAPGSGEQAVDGARGSYRGEGVRQAVNTQSLFQDAAEEMSFGVADRKSLSRRRIKSETGIRSTAMEQARAYLEKVPDLGTAERLTEFVDALKKQGRLDPQALREQARRFSEDPTHQFAALSFAREQLAREGGAEELQGALQAAIDGLLEEHGPEVRAGLNVSGTASEFVGTGLGGVGELRGLYRDTVLDYRGLTQAYGSLMERYGAEGFVNSVSFMLKALSADLYSEGASIDEAKLKTIMDDMYQLKVLGGLHEDCTVLVERMRARGLRPDYQPHDLMCEALKLKDQTWVGSTQVDAIVDGTGIGPLEDRIAFLREFKELVRLIPEKVYDDPDMRGKVLDAVQYALDGLIEQEDE